MSRGYDGKYWGSPEGERAEDLLCRRASRTETTPD
jgi:hypothetical protein